MKVTVERGKLSGCINAVPSKSFGHRNLLCAALSDQPTVIYNLGNAKDILATRGCLEALGAKTEDVEGGVKVYPARRGQKSPFGTFDCLESGSTLRFLLPVAAALTTKAEFVGRGRLPERPMKELVKVLQIHGKVFSEPFLPFEMSGELSGGIYEIPGDISSQYVSGLLMALPLVKEDSEIKLTTRLTSSGYVDITLKVMEEFGIKICKTKEGYRIKGGQHYVSPSEQRIEGDWSNAAFFFAANALKSQVEILGLQKESLQRDREILEILEYIKQKRGPVDLSNVPDLLPVLCVVATQFSGETVFFGGEKLRFKESDRIASCCNLINVLGGEAKETADGIIVTGKKLNGGVVDGCNDHRIVMAASVAGLVSERPVTIIGAEAVEKSYPGFFSVWEQLGGNVSWS